VTRRRFKKLWTLLRFYLVLRELKRQPPATPMAFALLLCACSVGAPPPEDPVVVILRDGLPACSGFAVDAGHVLTAAHCVGDRSEVAFATASQWQHTARGFTLARVEYVDRARDIASLSSGFNFQSFLKLREPTEGESVLARSVFFNATTRGTVLAGAGFFRDTTMGIQFGWSGSPVLGGDGKVVGLVHSCLAAGEGRARGCLPLNAQITVLP